jgi:CheY-like chemotaxis protein
MMRRVAESAGLRVSEANPEEVGAELARTSFDVAVVASQLTEGDALMVTLRLCAVRDKTGKPRLILVGDEASPIASLADARARGADGFLSRPVDPEILVSTVHELATGAGAPTSSAPGATAGRASPEAHGVTAVPALTGRGMELREERIRSQLLRVQHGDYFAILGVARAASGAEIRTAYEQACQEFDAAYLGDALAQEHAHDLATIRVVLDESLRVLGDDEVREAYLAHLK